MSTENAGLKVGGWDSNHSDNSYQKYIIWGLTFIYGAQDI